MMLLGNDRPVRHTNEVISLGAPYDRSFRPADQRIQQPMLCRFHCKPPRLICDLAVAREYSKFAGPLAPLREHSFLCHLN